MHCLILSNEATLVARYSSDAVQSEVERGSSRATWTPGDSGKTIVLSWIEHELIRALSLVEAVNALYAERDDDDDVLMVFVVVPEHEDVVYHQVIDERALRPHTGQRRF